MSFKFEVDFGFDNFQQPKVLNPKDSIAQVILNLFTMRPGSMPSMPHIGLNIREYLYKLEGEVDVDELKNKIYSQCSELLSFVPIGELQVFFTPYQGTDILVIILPIHGLDENDDVLLMGFQKSDDSDMLFTYQFEQGNVFN